MEQRFEFEGAAVRSLVAESEAAAERLYTEAQRYVAAGFDLDSEDPAAMAEPEHPTVGAPPGLWLVSDQGVYLRSNASAANGGIVPARGYETTVPPGLESLCEFIDAAPLGELRADDTLVVTLRDRRMRLSLIRPA